MRLNMESIHTVCPNDCFVVCVTVCAMVRQQQLLLEEKTGWEPPDVLSAMAKLPRRGLRDCQAVGSPCRSLFPSTFPVSALGLVSARPLQGPPAKNTDAVHNFSQGKNLGVHIF